MARRATYFFDVHKTESPRILVSGGWEYLEPLNPEEAVPAELTKLAKAYDYMKYDVAFMGENEARHLAQLGVKVEPNRKTTQTEQVTTVSTADGRKVAFIRFPSLPKGDDIPSEELIAKVSMLTKRAYNEADLLIGLSDWGYVGEREYLAQDPEYMPDFLFGSGHGSGVTGRFTANSRCGWYRPYDKGRTVIEVRLNAWPDRTKPFEWKEPDTILSLSFGLTDNYKDHPDVSAILK